MKTPMKCLTVRQPWAWAIFHAGKPVENRSRRDGRMPAMCSHRGELWIHAATWGATHLQKLAIAEQVQGMPIDAIREHHGDGPLTLRMMPLGAIIGRVRVVGHVEPAHAHKGAPPGCVLDAWLGGDVRPLTDAERRWWTGDHGLVLADPEPLPETIPWRKGRLGIWTMPDELAEQVRRAIT